MCSLNNRIDCELKTFMSLPRDEHFAPCILIEIARSVVTRFFPGLKAIKEFQ